MRLVTNNMKILKKTLNDKTSMTREEYLSNYLCSFLGNYPCKINNFDSNFHRVVDSNSLCNEEIDYFHKMIDCRLEESENYIDKWIKLFKETKNLDACQLGPNMLKFLEGSKNLTIS